MRRTAIVASVLLISAAAWCEPAPPDAGTALIRVPVWLAPGTDRTDVSSFRASVGGVSSKILSVKGPGDDLLLIVALDMTQDLTRATLAKQALAAEIANLPPNAAVAVMRAQDSLKVLADPTTARAAVTGAIEALPVSGKAGLLDTVEFLGRTGDAVLRRSTVRVAIFYITDSDIQNYRENFTNPVVNSSDTRDLSRKFPEMLIQERITKLSTRLVRQQTPLFIVHLVYRSDRLNEAYQSGLQQLSETTAGTAMFCRSSAEVADSIRKTFETICNHYSFTLALPPRQPKKIQVEITTDGPLSGKLLTYRTQFGVKGK
jgi:hypothetical protein